MNDFTKEELEIIRNLINNLDEKMLTWSEKVILVQSKLQSMIDNYCEHDKKPIIKKITKAIDSCKAYGTKESEMLIFAYQNVLRWMAEYKV